MSRDHDLIGKNAQMGRDDVPIELHSAPTALSRLATNYYAALRNKP